MHIECLITGRDHFNLTRASVALCIPEVMECKKHIHLLEGLQDHLRDMHKDLSTVENNVDKIRPEQKRYNDSTKLTTSDGSKLDRVDQDGLEKYEILSGKGVDPYSHSRRNSQKWTTGGTVIQGQRSRNTYYHAESNPCICVPNLSQRLTKADRHIQGYLVKIGQIAEKIEKLGKTDKLTCPSPSTMKQFAGFVHSLNLTCDYLEHLLDCTTYKHSGNISEMNIEEIERAMMYNSGFWNFEDFACRCCANCVWVIRIFSSTALKNLHHLKRHTAEQRAQLMKVMGNFVGSKSPNSQLNRRTLFSRGTNMNFKSSDNITGSTANYNQIPVILSSGDHRRRMPQAFHASSDGVDSFSYIPEQRKFTQPIADYSTFSPEYDVNLRGSALPCRQEKASVSQNTESVDDNLGLPFGGQRVHDQDERDFLRIRHDESNQRYHQNSNRQFVQFPSRAVLNKRLEHSHWQSPIEHNSKKQDPNVNAASTSSHPLPLMSAAVHPTNCKVFPYTDNLHIAQPATSSNLVARLDTKESGNSATVSSVHLIPDSATLKSKDTETVPREDGKIISAESSSQKNDDAIDTELWNVKTCVAEETKIVKSCSLSVKTFNPLHKARKFLTRCKELTSRKKESSDNDKERKKSWKDGVLNRPWQEEDGFQWIELDKTTPLLNSDSNIKTSDVPPLTKSATVKKSLERNELKCSRKVNNEVTTTSRASHSRSVKKSTPTRNKPMVAVGKSSQLKKQPRSTKCADREKNKVTLRVTRSSPKDSIASSKRLQKPTKQLPSKKLIEEHISSVKTGGCQKSKVSSPNILKLPLNSEGKNYWMQGLYSTKQKQGNRGDTHSYKPSHESGKGIQLHTRSTETKQSEPTGVSLLTNRDLQKEEIPVQDKLSAKENEDIHKLSSTMSVKVNSITPVCARSVSLKQSTDLSELANGSRSFGTIQESNALSVNNPVNVTSNFESCQGGIVLNLNPSLVNISQEFSVLSTEKSPSVKTKCMGTSPEALFNQVGISSECTNDLPKIGLPVNPMTVFAIPELSPETVLTQNKVLKSSQTVGKVDTVSPVAAVSKPPSNVRPSHLICSPTHPSLLRPRVLMKITKNGEASDSYHVSSMHEKSTLKSIQPLKSLLITGENTMPSAGKELRTSRSRISEMPANDVPTVTGLKSVGDNTLSSSKSSISTCTPQMPGSISSSSVTFIPSGQQINESLPRKKDRVAVAVQAPRLPVTSGVQPFKRSIMIADTRTYLNTCTNQHASESSIPSQENRNAIFSARKNASLPSAQNKITFPVMNHKTISADKWKSLLFEHSTYTSGGASLQQDGKIEEKKLESTDDNLTNGPPPKLMRSSILLPPRDLSCREYSNTLEDILKEETSRQPLHSSLSIPRSRKRLRFEPSETEWIIKDKEWRAEEHCSEQSTPKRRRWLSSASQSKTSKSSREKQRSPVSPVTVVLTRNQVIDGRKVILTPGPVHDLGRNVTLYPVKTKEEGNKHSLCAPDRLSRVDFAGVGCVSTWKDSDCHSMSSNVDLGFQQQKDRRVVVSLPASQSKSEPLRVLMDMPPYLLQGRVTEALVRNTLNFTKNQSVIDAYNPHTKEISANTISQVSTTISPRNFARDLIYRIFTIGELQGKKINSQKGTGHLKPSQCLDADKVAAVKAVVLHHFPIEESHWYGRCVPFINDSIKQLFHKKLTNPAFWWIEGLHS